MQHGAAVDVAPAGDDAVGRRLDPVHRPLGEMRPAVDPDLDEGPLVDEQVDPLARGQLAALVLLGDLLLAAAEPRLLAAPRAAGRSARPATPCPAACGRSRSISLLVVPLTFFAMSLLLDSAGLVPGRVLWMRTASANRRPTLFAAVAQFAVAYERSGGLKADAVGRSQIEPGRHATARSRVGGDRALPRRARRRSGGCGRPWTTPNSADPRPARERTPEPAPTASATRSATAARRAVFDQCRFRRTGLTRRSTCSKR